MPELPEVEVVRRGLDEHVVGRDIVAVEVTGLRSVRRQPGGPDELAAGLVGREVSSAQRRGKYLWLTLGGGGALAETEPLCLLVHLGMSGQMLVADPDTPRAPHQHVTARLSDGRELRFIDQRTFGGWTVVPLAPARDGSGRLLPVPAAHVAADPLEEAYDRVTVARSIRRRDSELKRVLLDQTVVSGIGNIYADEALWRAGVHGRRRGAALTRTKVEEVLADAGDVMAAALVVGGTSFDALYVNVNGASGYFERSLEVYGRADEPCSRCGTAIVREEFMNRGSHFCPRCQPAPRGRRAVRRPTTVSLR